LREKPLERNPEEGGAGGKRFWGGQKKGFFLKGPKKGVLEKNGGGCWHLGRDGSLRDVASVNV